MRCLLRGYLVAISLLLVPLVACGSTGASAPPKPAAPAQSGQPTGPLPVKFGWQLQADYIFFNARAGQVFQEAGLAPEYVQFPSGREMLAALQSKSIDVAAASGVVFNVARAQDLDVKAIFVYQDHSANEGLVARPQSNVRQVTDLVGKRVGYTRGSAAHYDLARALANANLSLDSVTLVDLGPDKAFAAFTNGDIDAWWVWQPWLAKAEAEGGQLVTTDKEQGLITPAVWYARSEWLAQNPEAAKRLMQGAMLSLERLQQDKTQGVRAVAQALAVPEEMSSKIFEQDYRPSAQEQLDPNSYLSITGPGGLARVLDEVGTFLFEQKIVAKRPEAGQAIDPGPLRAAVQDVNRTSQ